MSSKVSIIPNTFLASCLFDDTEDELIQDDIPVVVEMNKQFGLPGSTVNLSGQDLSGWLAMQSLCARLSRSDNAKSIIYLDHCCLGRHGAAIVSRSFTHVLIRAGSYMAKWLPLMHPNGRILVLSMINNDIGPDGAAAVAKMLRVNSGLRELNLRFNALRPDGAQYLASALYVNDTLRFLCVSGNDLCGVGEEGTGEMGLGDHSGVASLFRSLHVNTRLRTLKIAENDLGNDGAKYAADALRENKCLRALDVHGNCLFAVLEEELTALSPRSAGAEDSGDEDSEMEDAPTAQAGLLGTVQSADPEVISVAAYLVDTVARHIETGAAGEPAADWKPSSGLVVRDHVANLHEFSGMDGGGAFLDAVGSSQHLESLDLSWNDMGPRSAMLFANSLLSNSVLNYMDFHGNPIGDIGIGAFSAFLASETCALEMLCLQRVDMTEVGAALLAEALSANNSVSKLNLSCNAIGPYGSEKLAHSLRKNVKLADLNMRSCGLGSEGVSHIANMLQYNHAITTLNLSCNDIDDHGATALAATVSLNTTLATLDISNYCDKLDPPSSADGDHLSIPLSALVAPFAGVLESSAHTTTKTRARDEPPQPSPAQPKTKRESVSVGVQGCQALGMMLRSKTNLQKLIISGHDLSAFMCNELLSAMDDTRVCEITADFKSFQWKYDDVMAAMAAEKDLLSSCYTPKTLRVHMCGQSSASKRAIVRGWCQHQQQQFGTFWMNMFNSQTAQDDTPGVEVSKLLLQNRSADICVWNYEGTNEMQDIWRLHMRAAPLSVVLIVVSSVGSTGQCRSALQVAAEISSWVRLLLTYGHQTRDIAVIISNGNKFEKAWKGLHPNSAGGVALDEVDMSTTASADGDLDSSTGSAPDDRAMGQSVTGLHSEHTQDLDFSLMDAAARKGMLASVPNPKMDASPPLDTSQDLSATRTGQLSSDGVVIPSTIPESSESAIAGLDESASSFIEASTETPSPCKKRLGRESTSSLLKHRSSKNPSEEQFVRNEGSAMDTNAELRRRFEESVRENISAVLGWRRTPGLYVWEEGGAGAMPATIDSWLTERYRFMAQHVQVPKICESLREKCLPLLRKTNAQKIISMDSLLVAAKAVVRSIQPVQLRQACHWLHLLGDVVVLDTEEIQPGQAYLWRGVTPAVLESKSRRGHLDPERKLNSSRHSTSSDGRSLRIQHDLALMRSYRPKRMCKIVLDPSWFSRCILVPLICRSPSLSKNQAALQPWCDKEYVLSLKEIEDFLVPLQASLNMTLSELLTALEVQRIGVHLTHMASFCVPNRMLGDKMTWLAARGITKAMSSQYSGSFSKLADANSVSIVLGRRVKAKHLHILPPGSFHCFQSHLLHTWVQQKLSSWRHHRIMCWERGIGITIEQPPAISDVVALDSTHDSNCAEQTVSDDAASFVSGQGGGYICILIETTPAWQQPDWSQDPNTDIDVLAWGEGLCTPDAIHAAVDTIVQMVYASVQTVCMGALRSEGDSVEALTVPNMDWLRLAYLRPGCVLHTLTMFPCDRICGEYVEDPDCCEPPEAPIMVACSHLQPRLCKRHLVKGYVVADSPGGGKGFLRSVFSSLEKGLDAVAQKGAVGIVPTPHRRSAGLIVSTAGKLCNGSSSGADNETEDGVVFQCNAIMASE